MGLMRDTSGEAMAAAVAEAARRDAGADDPPLTLSGRDRKSVREAVLDAYRFILDVEERTKEYRLRARARTVRTVLGAAIAHLPEAEPPKR